MHNMLSFLEQTVSECARLKQGTPPGRCERPSFFSRGVECRVKILREEVVGIWLTHLERL